jgi:hypothetical protein
MSQLLMPVLIGEMRAKTLQLIYPLHKEKLFLADARQSATNGAE